jgi:hypothetical protein
MLGHFLPDVCPEILPLLWRPVIFRPSHQLFRSNQAEAAKRRGTRKLRTYQSGITEEHVRRPRDVKVCTVRCGESEGTNVLLLLGNYTNNLSGTDGHRTVGRTWHASRWKNSAWAEAISWSTRNVLPLPHPKKIRSHLHLTIRGFYLSLVTLKPHLILVGRSRPRHGKPCCGVSSRENRSVTSREITACRMRRSAVCCVPLVAAKWDV